LNFDTVFQLTFPDNQNFPAGFFQFYHISFIAGFIRLAFILPESGVGGGGAFAFFAVMRMPEAAVEEDYFFVARLLFLKTKFPVFYF
jgi:hypothetical protein